METFRGIGPRARHFPGNYALPTKLEVSVTEMDWMIHASLALRKDTAIVGEGGAISFLPTSMVTA